MDEKAKILIVEDEQIIALEIRRKLESMGYDVSAIVSSGEEAVRMAEELHPDLVLMDIILQGEMDGVEAAGQIHTRFDIPVVYVTANISDARLEDIARSEPFGCLFKPFENMELQAAVRVALYRYSMEKKLKESQDQIRAQYQGSPIPTFTWQKTGDDFVLVDYNNAAIAITHGQSNKYVGKTASEMYQNRFEIQENLHRCLNEKTIIRNEILSEHFLPGKHIITSYAFVPPDLVIVHVIDITDRKQAEEGLRKSEEKLRKEMIFARTIIQSTPTFFVAINAEGKTIMMNESMLHALKYAADEVVGKDYKTSFVPERDQEVLTSVFENLIKSHEPTLGENRVLTRDGRELLVEWRGRSILDEHGKFEYFFGMGIDITDRRRTEESLRKSEERFRTIFESTKEGYSELDLAGRFTLGNETTLRMMRLPSEKFIGVSFKEYTSPETAERLYGIFNELYRTGESAEITGYEIIRKDGSKAMVELSAYLIRDEKGNPAGFRGITRDVTKRKEMENQLEGNFQYLRAVMAAAPYAIIALDRYNQIVRWNPAAEKLFGYSKKEALGRDLDSLVTTGDIMDEAKGFTKIAMSGEGLSAFETVRFRKDGSPVDVIAAVSPIMVNGELIGAVALYDDITDRKQAEEEIKNHQEHLALINQILRHDLTNDLVVIQSALNLYNNSPEDELLEEISSRTKKSIELINSMRELETFISRHRELQIHDMRDTIDEVIKNHPSIDFDIKGKARVMADDSIASVIDNIIRNAVIHGKADKITITTGKERDMCEVRIADNGTGIPDDIKKKIFEEGFKYGDTGHTGIGLYIVEKAMESYGGYAWVEDNEPKGAVIVLRFKMVK